MSRTSTKAASGREEARDLPPRERIVAVASDLFYRQGIRAVGVETIAEAAGTNKMTLYRHFESKDALVAEYLRRLAATADGLWDELEAAYPREPRKQLLAWFKTVSEQSKDPGTRGCALANAAVELPEKHHPARCVIERHKQGQRDRLVKLCRAAGAVKPDLLADQLFLLLEGARVSCQSLGPKGPCATVADMGKRLIDSHLK
jgi:AcrR family transcriptional regulator